MYLVNFGGNVRGINVYTDANNQYLELYHVWTNDEEVIILKSNGIGMAIVLLFYVLKVCRYDWIVNSYMERQLR